MSRTEAIKLFKNKSYRERYKARNWRWPDIRGMGGGHKPGDLVYPKRHAAETLKTALDNYPNQQFWLISSWYVEYSGGFTPRVNNATSAPNSP